MMGCSADARGTRQGFTLLELLVALGLLALLATVAIPTLTGRSGGVALTASAQAIADGLNRTRGHALASNRARSFEIDLAERWFRGAEDVRPGRISPAFAISVTTALSQTGPDARVRFRFFPDGTASGGKIVLSGASGRREVAIDWLTGRVQIIR